MADTKRHYIGNGLVVDESSDYPQTVKIATIHNSVTTSSVLILVDEELSELIAVLVAINEAVRNE